MTCLLRKKYLSAAWSLSLEPLIGEHLVQVYDKLGRQERAAEIASLALAAIPRTATLSFAINSSHDCPKDAQLRPSGETA